MVIQHNMNAMNSNRQLGLVTGGLAKLSEKLSSGYKINRAADDAAGLSISEKMRKQIRGLDQASENIEDGISLCQVADGALNETMDILQRMRELAVQAANGTNSVGDRQSIELEITQLKSEVDRIAETTKFNDAVYPLNAPITYSNKEIVKVGAVDMSPESIFVDPIVFEKTVTVTAKVTGEYNGTPYRVGDTFTVTGLTTASNEEYEITTELWPALRSFNPDGTRGGWVIEHPLNIPVKFFSLEKSDFQADENGYLYVNARGARGKYYLAVFERSYTTGQDISLILYRYEQILQYPGSSKPRFATMLDLYGGQKLVTPEVTQKPITMQVTNYGFSSNESTAIHSGDSSSQANKIQVRTVNATCKGLGISDMTAATEDSSTIALVLLDRAITKASSYRSAFGASQNRLEHAQKIDDNTAENTQAAESQIRDTDMALEMVRYSNANILMQAGQSMLSQANQSRQGILSLIA